jgi:DNA-binding MarR family transcriptional regulator
MTAVPGVDMDQIAILRHTTLKLTRRLRKHSNPVLTPSQMSALWTLERHESMRVGELARREQIGKSSVTRLVARLEELGHVSRHADPADGRSSFVSLTSEGRALLAEVNQLANNYLARQVDALPTADQELLMNALPVLERLVAHRP